MESVPAEATGKPLYFPQRSVVRESAESTKLHVVVTVEIWVPCVALRRTGMGLVALKRYVFIRLIFTLGKIIENTGKIQSSSRNLAVDAFSKFPFVVCSSFIALFIVSHYYFSGFSRMTFVFMHGDSIVNSELDYLSKLTCSLDIFYQ